MKRNINKQDGQSFQSTAREEGSMLLIHAYYLRPLPRRRRPTTMSETEETMVDSKIDSCDRIGESWPSENNYPDSSPTRTRPSSVSLHRSEMNSIDFPPRTHDSLTSRQRIPHASQGRDNMYSSKRMRLLIFIKIILRCLDSDDPSLHLKAKKIVTDCTRKNREGVQGYNPLADVITRQLRMTVGEVHWNRANRLMEYYLKKRGDKTLSVENQR